MFVADPVLRTFRWRMRDWLADRGELPELVFVHENAQAIRLFCAVARCSQCNQPEISSDTLHCYVCGHSAQVCERGKVVQGVLTGRLPVGFRMLLQSHYLTARRAAGFRNQECAATSRYISQAERTLYELQSGRCYYCIRPLAALRTPGGWVCDHLEARLNGGTNAQENLALTCWDCNEQKGRRNEDVYWTVLFARLGGAEISRRREAMAHVRTWRDRQAGRKLLGEQARSLREARWMQRIERRAQTYLSKAPAQLGSNKAGHKES